ncbi:transposase, IS4 family [Trichodesmium erythraeum IMS101]|uniref:Transposase, IS4 family n=1 Tax=Trichodesmium erythraeum (strain IMS101) TaxID=203124 RepID=Q10XL3_TRIEI
MNLVTENSFLLLDRGFYYFNFWLKLIDKKVDFITRKKRG